MLLCGKVYRAVPVNRPARTATPCRALIKSTLRAVIEGFSEEFETTFMEHLRRSHPFSRVMAKNVYNEYIADK